MGADGPEVGYERKEEAQKMRSGYTAGARVIWDLVVHSQALAFVQIRILIPGGHAHEIPCGYYPGDLKKGSRNWVRTYLHMTVITV